MQNTKKFDLIGMGTSTAFTARYSIVFLVAVGFAGSHDLDVPVPCILALGAGGEPNSFFRCPGNSKYKKHEA